LFVCYSDELEFKEHLDLERGQYRDEERLITGSFYSINANFVS